MKDKRRLKSGGNTGILVWLLLGLLFQGCAVYDNFRIPESVDNPEIEQKIEYGKILLATVQSDPCLEDIVSGIPEESWRCGTPISVNTTSAPEATDTTAVNEDIAANPPKLASVDWSEAGAFVGEFKSVCGRVVDSYFAHASNGQPTFLNIGKEYPDPERFTILIWGNQLENFPFNPDEYYLGRMVCVRGLIKEYNGSLEIIADRPEQIEVLEE